MAKSSTASGKKQNRKMKEREEESGQKWQNVKENVMKKRLPVKDEREYNDSLNEK